VLNGEDTEIFPSILENIEPRYIELKGWRELSREEWREIASSGYSTLPREIIKYIECIEEILEKPIKIISIGPSREETIFRQI